MKRLATLALLACVLLQGCMTYPVTLRSEAVDETRYNVVSFSVDGKYTVEGYVTDKNVVERVRTVIDNDVLGNTPVEAIFRVLMVSVLGVCMVRLCDRMAPGEDADVLARTTIDAVLTGFRTGFTHSYRPDNCL